MFYNTPDPAAPRRNRAKTWIIRLLITFIVLWVIWIAFISLLSQARHIPKEDLERTLSESLNMNITIGALDDFTLYPSVRFAAKDVVFARRQAPEKPMVSAGLLDVGMDFKQAAIYQGWFQHLVIAAVNVSAADYGLPDLFIDGNKVKMGKEQSRMSLSGKLGDAPVRIVVPLLHQKGDDGKDAFRFSADRSMTVVLNGATMEGKLMQTENGLAVQPFVVAGQRGVLSINRPASVGQPVDVVLALPQLQAAQMTDPTQPLPSILTALLPPVKEMREVPDAMDGATIALRLSVEQWVVAGQKHGAVTLAWVYKNGRWIQPVIATHKLSPVGLQDLQTMLMDMATGKVPEKPKDEAAKAGVQAQMGQITLPADKTEEPKTK